MSFGKFGREVDLHGYHPRDDDIGAVIAKALKAAFEEGADTLTIIHGHGKGRRSWSPQFANTNTGYLGLTIRQILRHDGDLRRYMLAKIDVSHDGSTKVRIRRKKKTDENS